MIFAASVNLRPVSERPYTELHRQCAERDCEARAAHLEHLDSQLRPFAQCLARLADRFELEQALALIARYLQPEE